MPKAQKPKEKNKTLVLLDVHAILHRAYHALPDFATKSGEPTGGLYGLVALLFKLVTDLNPDYIIACYDLPKPTFRDEVYADYKAGRQKADDALIKQIKRSNSVFEALNIPIYALEGFEADDIIGTIAEKVKQKAESRKQKGKPSPTTYNLLPTTSTVDVIIASGDMDTLQLVDGKHVRVYTLRKGLTDTVIYDEEKVRERFGFGPELLPDYKGLRGDPSDNIPGVPGIGEKTATELIVKFGGLEAIYKMLQKPKDKPSPSHGVTGRGFVDDPLSGVKPRIVQLLRDNEEEASFSKMLGTVRRDAPIEWKLPEKTWRESVDLVKFETLCKELEFRTLAARARSLLGATGGEDGVRSTEDGTTQRTPDSVLRTPQAFDTESIEFKKAAIALFILDSDKTRATAQDIIERTKKETIKEALASLEAELAKIGLETVYRNIELPIVPLLEEAMGRGVYLDVPYLQKLGEKYHKKLAGHEKKIFALAGHEFNVNSPKQMGEVLFDELRLEVKGLKKTDGGARSTRESELIKLKDVHPIIGEILDYRELGKLLSTYVDVLPKLTDEHRRIHTRLNQTGAATGRMSSDSPNLQNIPHHGTYGDEVRDAFTATPTGSRRLPSGAVAEGSLLDERGYKLAAFDYSQIEMRILATLSGDEQLIETFKSGKDVHAAVAARVFDVAEKDVTPEMRRRAKVINFGIIYGMGVQALKQNLGTSLAEAKYFHEAYFRAYPTIHQYFDQVIRDAKKKGYTETLFGRRRYLPDLRSHIPYIRASAERMAMNAPVQGTATGDIIKIAIKKVHDALERAKLLRGSHLLLQVHDELLYELREDSHLDEKIELIKEAMENAVDVKLLLDVPLAVNVATGERWGSMASKA